METRSQRLATQAIGKIKAVADQDISWKKDYGRLWLKFPYLVLTNGLMATVAFYRSKGKPQHEAVLSDLGEILGAPATTPVDIYVRGLPVLAYMRATRHALLAAAWYKRFAESVLDVKLGEDEGEET